MGAHVSATDAGQVAYQQVFQPEQGACYGPSAPGTPVGPATPRAGCDFSMQYQLVTPMHMAAGVQYSVFAEPGGPHSPEAAGLARKELTQLAELLGQAAMLSPEDMPQQVREGSLALSIRVHTDLKHIGALIAGYIAEVGGGHALPGRLAGKVVGCFRCRVMVPTLQQIILTSKARGAHATHAR